MSVATTGVPAPDDLRRYGSALAPIRRFLQCVCAQVDRAAAGMIAAVRNGGVQSANRSTDRQ